MLRGNVISAKSQAADFFTKSAKSAAWKKAEGEGGLVGTRWERTRGILTFVAGSGSRDTFAEGENNKNGGTRRNWNGLESKGDDEDEESRATEAFKAFSLHHVIYSNARLSEC